MAKPNQNNIPTKAERIVFIVFAILLVLSLITLVVKENRDTNTRSKIKESNINNSEKVN